MMMNCKDKAIRLLRIFASKLYKVKKQVIFDSFSGKQYSDNPRAISEKLHELYPDIKIVWVMNEGVQDYYNLIPDYVKIVKKKSLSYFRAFSSSFAYVTNEAMTTNMYKRKNQYFIQTWHGDRVPKKVLHESWRGQERPEPVMDRQYTDLCVAASSIGEQVYRSAFRYDGEILKKGMPRNDKLINQSDEEKNKIRKRLGLDADTKIILYAPTFRDHVSEKQSTVVDLKRVIGKLEKNGEKWKCLIRAHSNSAGIICEYNDMFMDVTRYFDMADLLLISDMLITDYSSSAGDFILRNKPVILTVYDYEEYISKHRELKFSLSDAGFFVVHNDDELIEIIENKSESDYKKNCDSIKQYFNIVEQGNSAEIICQKIHGYYLKNVKDQ
jgi:CDP-glycerol glycerophosphotransferase